MDGGDIARRGHVLRLGGHFLETSSIWCPFLTLHAGLPTGPYNTKLVMAVRAQQALLRQRGVSVTSSQECFLVPLDSVVWRGGGGDGSSHFAVDLPSCLQHRLLSPAAVFPSAIQRGLCNKASRTNKGIPHAYLVERRGGINGNLTYTLTLVILLTNS